MGASVTAFIDADLRAPRTTLEAAETLERRDREALPRARPGAARYRVLAGTTAGEDPIRSAEIRPVRVSPCPTGP